MKDLIHEVHRRSLWQVLGIYLAGSWVVLQVVGELVQSAGLPDWVPSLALVLLLIGLPMVMATAFVQEGLPGREAAARASTASHADTVAFGGHDGGSGREVSTAWSNPAEKTEDEPKGIGWLRGNVFTWRNAIGGGIGAMALFGTATAVWMVLRSAGIGAAGTLVARGLIEDGERVVLADFSGDSALALAATAALRVQLAGSGVVSPAEPALVNSALGRMAVDDEEAPLDIQRAREVAEREGFKAVVGGSVVDAGSGYLVTAQVIETATGNELVNVGQSVSDAGNFLDALDRVGRKLRERLGESLGSIRETAELERATTSSLEALRKYSRAVEAIDDRDRDRGVALLDEAIAIDSAFGMAWRKLAVADPGRRDTAATRAYELRDRLTERERYHTIGLYHFYVTQDYDEAAIAYRALLDAYPNDATALNNLAVIYERLGQLELSAEMFGRATKADPYGALLRENHVEALYTIGRIDSARVALERFADDFPGNPRVAWHKARFAYLDGDIERAEEELEPLLSSEIPSVQRNANAYVANLRVLEGRLREGERIWRQSLESPNPFREAMWMSRLDLDVRADTTGALERMRAAVAAAPDSVLDDRAGLLSDVFYVVGDVERGDRFHERDLAADSLELANMPERFRPMWESFHRFQRSLAMGEYGDALAAYREASSLSRRLFPHRDPARIAPLPIPAFEALGQPDSVIARYETWLERRELVDRAEQDAGRLPRAHERLAQLYDAQGDTEEAAVHYARFVELWKDADAELQPRVEAARQRLEEIVRERG